MPICYPCLSMDCYIKENRVQLFSYVYDSISISNQLTMKIYGKSWLTRCAYVAAILFEISMIPLHNRMYALMVTYMQLIHGQHEKKQKILGLSYSSKIYRVS